MLKILLILVFVLLAGCDDESSSPPPIQGAPSPQNLLSPYTQPKPVIQKVSEPSLVLGLFSVSAISFFVLKRK